LPKNKAAQKISVNKKGNITVFFMDFTPLKGLIPQQEKLMI